MGVKVPWLRLTEVLLVWMCLCLVCWCVCVCVCVCVQREWSGSSIVHKVFIVDSLCGPVRLSATAMRILELEKAASAQTSAH
jgi:hypothetical protein